MQMLSVGKRWKNFAVLEKDFVKQHLKSRKETPH